MAGEQAHQRLQVPVRPGLNPNAWDIHGTRLETRTCNGALCWIAGWIRQRAKLHVAAQATGAATSAITTPL